MSTIQLISCLTVGCASCWSAVATHPVYPPPAGQSSVPTLLGRVEPLLAMSDQELRDFVPKINGFLFCGCPNCTMGTQEQQIAWKGIADPDKAYCRYCGMEYPNPQYPEDQTIEGTNFLGEKVTYHYYEDPQGGRHYFTGRINYEKKHWLAARASDLAALYAVTKDAQYARKAAVLIDALAEAYSHWCVHHDLCFGKKEPVEPKPPYPYWGGIWNRWFYADIPVNVIRAYDLIAASGELEKLSAELGIDVRQRIEDRFFRFSVEFVKTYRETMSNMSPVLYEGMVVAGRVLGEPDYVHDAVGRFKELLGQNFHYDGFWHEGSISYHNQTIYHLNQVADAAHGYSDPEGYTSPRDGQHFVNLDLMAEFPLAQVALDMHTRFVYPNGRIIPCHDAWASEKGAPLPRSEPWILPGMGHAILGSGEGDHQTQAHLHFSGGYGHQHLDNLSLAFFACQNELLSDIGYTHTKYRIWTSCTPAHNTVAIDERDHAASGHTCNLLLWAPRAGPVQVVEAEARASYPQVAKRFRRLLALIRLDNTRAYVLDIFRVAGGQQHDWFLHGSADVPQTADCSLPLTSQPYSLYGPGVEFQLPARGESDSGKAPAGKSIGYGFIRNLQTGVADHGATVSFRLAGQTPVTFTTTVLGQPQTQLVLGEAPTIRQAGENDSEVDKALMPVLVLRRQGQDLVSTFVAVHRGWQGEDFVRSVQPLPGLPTDPDITALVVEHALGKDVIYSCTEEAASRGAVATGQPTPLCDARLALVRYDPAGKVVAQVLIGGKRLAVEGADITADGPATGKVLGVRRAGRADDEYGLEVSGPLPTGTSLASTCILVTHPDGTTSGHEIRAVEPAGDGAVVWLAADPGFVIAEGKTKFLYFPRREVEGENEYRVENVVATWAQAPPP